MAASAFARGDIDLVTILAITNLLTLVALIVVLYRTGGFNFLKVNVGAGGDVPVGGFSKLPTPFIEALEKVGTRINLAAHQVLFKEGDAGDSIFVIIAGRINVVKIIDGKNELLESYKRGELVGEGAFLSGMPRTAGGVAAEKSIVLKVDRERLEKLPEANAIAGVIWRTFSWHKFDGYLRNDPQLKKTINARKRQYWFSQGATKTLAMNEDVAVPEPFAYVFIVSGKASVGGIEHNGPALVPMTVGRQVHAQRVVHLIALPELAK